MRQVSVRDLLFLFVIAALALGWWLDRRPIPARFQSHLTTNHFVVVDTATGQVWEQPIDPNNGLMIGTQITAPKLPK